MTDVTPEKLAGEVAATGSTRFKPARSARTRKRAAAETRFRLMGLSAVVVSGLFLVLLLWTVIGNALPAFTYNYVNLPLDLTSEKLTRENAGNFDYRKTTRNAIQEAFPDVTDRKAKRTVRKLLSSGAAISVRWDVADNLDWVGTEQTVALPLSDTADLYLKGLAGDITRPESERQISDKEIELLDDLKSRGLIETNWNSIFFSNGASREPEMAGIWGAVVGSFLTLIVTLLLSFPVGVGAAVYLEEFAPKNKVTDFLEVNINNLAAVPSIVFGLLGLAIFLNWGNLPRSAPLVGGMVLALMTLPTIIIAARAALKSVPPSIREAALGVGASETQATFHHVLPLAMPGVLTGAIIGMARALGETAPLLMIGMVAFIVDIPGSFTDPATVLPVQIYMWADFPEIGFQQKTAAATLILLGFLILMNGFAVWLRSRFERRW